MLKKTQSLVGYHVQAAKQSLELLSRKPLSTFMTVVVIGMALAIPTLFGLLTNNLSKLTVGWQQGGNISLYLAPALSSADQQHLLQQIRATPGVGKATLKSPEEGLAELTKQEGMQDVMRYLPENPLPAVIDVSPAADKNAPAQVDLLARELQKLPHIDQAKLDMEWISRLHAIVAFTGNAASVLMALLALAVVLIIGNTLRLGIHTRHEEIQILKLVGAPDSFILRPFLYSGAWYGVAGAFLAAFLVNMVIFTLGNAINQLAFVYQMHYPLDLLSIRQILLLLLFAIILGWLGARLSVKRQLASIEPYN